jgi:hypothetical protein
MIVTLCGSMKFFTQMLEVAAEETARGRIVLAPFVMVAEPDQGSEMKSALDTLHRRKIMMSDHVIVVTDQFGYRGSSTEDEIAFALQAGRTVEIRKRFVENRIDPLTGKIDTQENYRARNTALVTRAIV